MNLEVTCSLIAQLLQEMWESEDKMSQFVFLTKKLHTMGVAVETAL